MTDTSSHRHAETFDRVSFPDGVPPAREYERCVFRNVDFSNAVWSGTDFVDCRFEECNLAMVQPLHCGLKQVSFVDCKMVGIDFSKIGTFALAVSFERCKLDFVRFTKLPLARTTFDACSLREASFAEADLTRSRFHECDLEGTIFQRTKLEHTDFRTARGFSIDPEQNRVARAKFSAVGLSGLLQKYKLVIE